MRQQYNLLTQCGLLFTCLLGTLSQATPLSWKQTILDTAWKIKEISPCVSLDETLLRQATQADQDGGWMNVHTMPAMVHDVLVEQGRIDVPWKSGGAQACEWVAKKDWLYACQFSIDTNSPEAWLHFEGLDTIVDVYLNGKRLASHSNMYWPLHVNVSEHLRVQNSLVLHFHTVFDPASQDGKPLKRYQGEQVRRPGQNYGNYLGPSPNFSRVGIYDTIWLEMSHGSRLQEVFVDASLEESLTKGTVTVNIEGKSSAKKVSLQAILRDPEGTIVSEATIPVSLKKGRFQTQIQLDTTNPQLWWPRGYGDQPLYQVQTTLLVQGKPHQIQSHTIGFRRITMSQPLHFVVNNVPVRLWGGDWVTPRWDTVVWDRTRVKRLLDMAENANFNVFRVWGVVESPHNDFYKEADRRGFLLWQDFTQLPLSGDERSRTICRRESEWLIKRLKHHPSILCWCGGNENAMWHHQEFNGQLDDRGPWDGLKAAMDVAAVCQQLDPDRYYQPSSPYGGDNPNAPEKGNTHGYTNMWYVSGYEFLNFASEDTRIAAPTLQSLQRFMDPQDIWPKDYSPVYSYGQIHPFPKAWLKYTTGSSWKKTGPVEQFYDPTNAAELVYRLGMAESAYYQDIIEKQRCGRPATAVGDDRRCGGYLVWKYNDSWPQVYSGKVDYFLEPYHCYYTLKRAYAPVMLCFEKGTYLYLWAVNDSTETISGTVTLQLFHVDRNEVRKEYQQQVTIKPGGSKVVVRLDEAGMHSFRLEHLLFASLMDERGQVLARADCLVDIERHMTFPEAKLSITIRDGALVICTDRYAHCVHLTGDAQGNTFGWCFEDNYFNLLPGEEKVVRILGDHHQGTIMAKPWYSPHTTQVSWTR